MAKYDHVADLRVEGTDFRVMQNLDEDSMDTFQEAVRRAARRAFNTRRIGFVGPCGGNQPHDITVVTTGGYVLGKAWVYPL